MFDKYHLYIKKGRKKSPKISVSEVKRNAKDFDRRGAVAGGSSAIHGATLLSACAECRIQTRNRKVGMVGNLSGAISAVVKLYRKYKTTTRQYGDVDNHLKALLDGFDAQIIRCVVEKYQDKEKPRAEIFLSQVLLAKG